MPLPCSLISSSSTCKNTSNIVDNSVANVLYHKTGLESLTVVPSTATYTLERLEYTSISKTFLPLAGLRGVSMLGRASSEKMFNDSKKKKKE